MPIPRWGGEVDGSVRRRRRCRNSIETVLEVFVMLSSPVFFLMIYETAPASFFACCLPGEREGERGGNISCLATPHKFNAEEARSVISGGELDINDETHN